MKVHKCLYQVYSKSLFQPKRDGFQGSFLIPEPYYIVSEQLGKRHHWHSFVCQNPLLQDSPGVNKFKSSQKDSNEDKRKEVIYGELKRDYIKGFIQNPYHDYRHVLDIKTILGFGINCKSREEIT